MSLKPARLAGLQAQQAAAGSAADARRQEALDGSAADARQQKPARGRAQHTCVALAAAAAWSACSSLRAGY
jgi:hypothetical protein